MLIQELRDLPFIENWPVPGIRSDKFLVLGGGELLEEITRTFPQRAFEHAGTGAELKIGMAPETNYVPGKQCRLRVVQTHQRLHRSRIDVILQQQGEDLFVMYQAVVRSPLRYLKLLVYVSAFVALWTIGFGLFWTNTDAMKAIILNSRQSSGNSRAAMEGRIAGVWMDPNSQEFYQGTRMTMIDALREDPGNFLSYVMIVSTVLAGLVGAVLMWASPHILRGPCGWIGWPTPEEFSAFVEANAAWVEATFSIMLLRDFGIGASEVHMMGTMGR